MDRLGFAQTVKVVGPEAAEKRRKDLAKARTKKASVANAGDPSASRSKKRGRTRKANGAGRDSNAASPPRAPVAGARVDAIGAHAIPIAQIRAVLRELDSDTLARFARASRDASTATIGGKAGAAAARPLTTLTRLCEQERDRRERDAASRALAGRINERRPDLESALAAWMAAGDGRSTFTAEELAIELARGGLVASAGKRRFSWSTQP